jgi:hypothetical protein
VTFVFPTLLVACRYGAGPGICQEAGSRLATSRGNGHALRCALPPVLRRQPKSTTGRTNSHFPDRCDTAKSERD